MADTSDRPGVFAPPPLIYLVALVMGIVAQMLQPWILPVPMVVRWLGGALAIAAVALGVTARATFVRAGTHVNPYQPATCLVTHGPFRFSRNPMYVAMTMLYAGATLMLRNGWLLVLLPVLMVLMHVAVVLREERYLGKKFGADYEAYCARVRRYL